MGFEAIWSRLLLNHGTPSHTCGRWGDRSDGCGAGLQARSVQRFRHRNLGFVLALRGCGLDVRGSDGLPVEHSKIGEVKVEDTAKRESLRTNIIIYVAVLAI